MKKNKISKLAFFLIGMYFLSTFFNSFIFTSNDVKAAAKTASFLMNPTSQTVKPGQEFEIDVVIDNSNTPQDIITAGFDITFPHTVLEVVDADANNAGIQINTENTDFSVTEPVLDTASNSTGIISFTAGTQGTNPVNDAEITVATIPFKVKEGITTQIAEIDFSTSVNTDIFVADLNGNPDSVLLDSTGASVIISNVSFSFNPSYSEVDNDDEFTMDIVLNNPDAVDIVTVAFEFSFDDEKLESKNSNDEIDVSIDSSYNFQVVENEIGATGTVVFTGGFTGSNPFSDSSITIGTIDFQAKAEGTANITFNNNVNASSVYKVDDANNNYLGSTVNGKYIIGEGGDTDAPESFANPRGGTYSTAQTVILSSDDNNAEIYYTTNGQSPTENSSRYNQPISITSNTTLKFFAIDEAGNKEDTNIEIYRVGVANYAIGITATKTEVNRNETISAIVKLVDTSINTAVANRVVTLTNSGSGSILPTSGTTDDEGEFVINYTAGDTSGTDVITATLSEDLSVKGYLNIEILGDDIANITLIGTTLSTTSENYVSATVKNSSGVKLSNTVPLELTVTKKGTSILRTYTSNTVNGVATFLVPGSDLESGTTYTLVARSNNITSNTVELTTPAIYTPEPYRPGGGSPNSGPKENILIFSALSIISAFFFIGKKQKVRAYNS